MDVFEAIKKRRSVRSFTKENVSSEDIEKILDAGRWAPSGLNNQPWKFMIVDESKKEKLATCTKYSDAFLSANNIIAVFLDKKESYDRTKDVQATGACIQNMLLAAHALGLGAVWQGEILNQREKAEKVLGVKENLELMAVILVGYPTNEDGSSERKSLDEILVASSHKQK
ncbi:MAG: nitroreductase [Candidatus Altiarchaeota archaeon]